MDEYYDHLDDVECPCPYHGALIQPLYPTAIKMLVYLAYYQEAGNCCQRTTKCRVHGCWEEKMDDFWTMRVPFCSRREFAHSQHTILTRRLFGDCSPPDRSSRLV